MAKSLELVDSYIFWFKEFELNRKAEGSRLMVTLLYLVLLSAIVRRCHVAGIVAVRTFFWQIALSTKFVVYLGEPVKNLLRRSDSNFR